MLQVHQKYTGTKVATSELWLPWDMRKRGRLRARTADNRDIGLFLKRGEPLREGEKLQSDCGAIIVVRAAAEELASAQCEDWLIFSRACNHLGNRHVPLQIEPCRLRFQRDPVLQQLVALLGMQVLEECAPFHPEAGAYREPGVHQHHHEHHHGTEHQGELAGDERQHGRG